MNDLELTVRLKADGSGLRGELRLSKREIDQLGQELDDAGRQASQAADKLDRYGQEAKEAGKESEALERKTQTLNSAFGGLKGLVAGLSLAAFTADLIDTNREFSLLRASLETVTGSSQAAEAAFGRIQEFAANTPFDLQQVTEAFIKLNALGLDPSERALTSYGNTASAMGKSLNQMIEAVADAAVGEFERLKEFGIQASSQGDQVTFTFRGVSTTVRKEAADIEAYLMRLGEVEFAGGMERQSKTLAGALSNLGDAWDTMLDRIISGNLESFFSTMIRSASWVLDRIGDLFAMINWVIDLIPTGLPDATRAIANMGTAADEAAKSTSTLNAATQDLAVSARELATVNLGTQWASVNSEIAELEGNISRVKGAIDQLVDDRAIAANKRLLETWEEQLDALQKQQGHLKLAIDSMTKLANLHYKNTTAATNHRNMVNSLTKAEAAHQNTLTDNMRALAQQYIELTQGARAAYEYNLRVQGFTDSEVQAQLALYDTVKALEEKRREEDAAATAAERHAKVNRDASTEFKKVWENAVSSVDNIFRDLWRGAFDGARDFGQSLQEWFGNLLAELAHQALTRPIVLSLGAVFGANPTASMAGQIGQGVVGQSNGLLGNATSLLGLGGSLTAAAGTWLAGTSLAGSSAFVTGLAGGLVNAGTLGIGGTLSTIGAGLTSGTVAGLGAAIGAAAPVLLPLALLAGAAGLFSDEEAKTKFHYRTTSGLEPGPLGVPVYGEESVRVDTAFGTLNAWTQHTGEEGQLSNEEARQLIQQHGELFATLAQFDQALADLVGDDGLAAAQAALAEWSGSLTSEKVVVDDWLRQRYDTIFGALGGRLSQAWSTVSGADPAQAVGAVVGLVGALDQLTHTTDLYAEAVAEAEAGVWGAYERQTQAAYDLIAAYDGSLESMTALTGGLQQQAQAAYQALALIDQASASVAQGIDSAIESLRLSQMSAAEQYDYLTAQAEALAAGLETLTDPAQIQQSVADILRYHNQAVGLLDEDQKAAMADDLIDTLEQVRERADERLAVARDQVADTLDAVASVVDERLAEVADRMAQAAATQQTAADQMEASTSRLADLLARLEGAIPEQIDVRVGGLLAEVGG